MAFTGEAVRQGNSTRFGVDSVGSTPRAFVSFGGEPYVITREGLIHITDLANGSGVLIQNNSGYNLSSPDPTCAFVYNARMYFLDRGGNTLQRFDDPLTGDVSLIDFYTGITSPSGAASDGTTVWVYDASFDALHTINPDTAVTTLLGTVGFDVTTPANGIGGMFYHDGSLYLLDNGTELMFVIEDPSAATLEATAVDVNVVEFGASQRGVNGGSVHDGEAYMAGGNPDALYRFYNVRWDETIAAVEVDAGGNGSLDLSTVSSDATSFEFTPGYTAPSWLTISGNDLVITSAPDVTSDTDFSPEVRALRGTKYEDETLTVRVAAVGSMIVTPSEPRSLLFSTFEDSIVVSWSEASDNGGESPTHYDVRIDGGSWISTELDTFYVFGNLSPETEYTIEIAQVNSAGRGAIASGTATTNSVPIVVPGAPTSLSLSETHSSIVAAWAAANDNGGEDPTRYDIRIDGGAWIDTGLDLTHAFSNLSAETEYTVEVAQVNSAGRGTAVSATVTTDAAPIVITMPGAPRSLSLTETHNSIVATWAAANDNGGESPVRYDIRIEGGAWIDTGLDLTHTFSSLSAETEYTIEVAQVNSAGRGPVASGSVTTDAAPIVITTPGAPRSLSLTETHNSIVTTWIAASDNGGEDPTRFDVRIDGGSWINAGLDLTHTFSGLSPETRYTIDVAQVNSAGRGAVASASVTTDVAPVVITVPGAPRSLSLAETHNSIVATWRAAANNGGESPTRYDIRINGGSWVNAGLDLTHAFENLSPETEYTIDVAQVNSAGRGADVTRSITTDTQPTLSPPQDLIVELTPTTALLKWTGAADAGDLTAYEVSFAEGSTLGSEWVGTDSTRTRFLVKELKRGTEYTFAVRGVNDYGTGTASRPVTQNTPIASLHNALFFKECVNYFDDGARVSEYGNPSELVRAVADNNYKTYTREKDLVINIAVGGNPTRVDAIFVKAKGVTRHSGTPSGGNGTGWTNVNLPSTVKNWEGTDVSTTVLGFQHHLLLLDQHFTATSVRVRFQGTNVEIYEIMLLEFGISIDANGDFTEIATNFVDREGVIHSDPGGGIAYDASIGDQRDKWEVDYVVKVVPNKTLLQTPEEFLYWRSENRNHVHAMEPSRFPWRVFPAVFVRKSVPVRYRTDDKLGGEVLNFRVAEQ